MPEVTLLRTKYLHSWPGRLDGEPAHVVPVENVLTQPYKTDAHYTAYVTPIERRLSRDAILPLAHAGARIEMALLVLDIDAPGHHATDEWRADLRARRERLERDHPGGVYHETRGGARVVYALPAPVLITSKDDALTWSGMYVVRCAYLKRRFGIVADLTCRDWQRPFRAPHATREGERAPESRLMLGDPHAIGPWRYERNDADLAHARELVPSLWPTARIAPLRRSVRPSSDRYGRAALEGASHDVAAAPQGQRHATLLRAAVRLASLGLDPGLLRAALETACATWGRRDVRADRATIDDGIRYGLAHTRAPRRTG